MAVSLVWRTDAHLADQPPQSRIDDWADTILNKLVQVGDIARQAGASAVLDGGDLFHVKSPSRTSHELIQRVTEIHRVYPCPTLGIVGNHDVKYGDIRFLSEAPLGVLFKSQIIQPCYDPLEVYFGQSDKSSPTVRAFLFDRAGTGWVQGSPFVPGRTEPVVRVVGIPFHGTQYDFARFTSIIKGEEDFLVVMVHCLASQRGGTMFEAEDIIKYEELASLDPDVFCFGHWHKDQGVKEIAKGKWVVNTGSLSRGSLSQDDLERTPSCVVLGFDQDGKITHEVKPLKVAPSAEVFDLVGRVRQEARKMTVDALVDSLHSALAVRQVTSLLDDVRALPDVPELVKERTLAYLEQTGAK